MAKSQRRWCWPALLDALLVPISHDWPSSAIADCAQFA
jgi:hypothetical protein